MRTGLNAKDNFRIGGPFAYENWAKVMALIYLFSRYNFLVDRLYLLTTSQIVTLRAPGDEPWLGLGPGEDARLGLADLFFTGF